MTNKPVPFQSLKGNLLIAMPNIDDLRFEKAVIYIYEHTPDLGAQGIVINRPAEKMTFSEILDQLKITHDDEINTDPILLGGPDQITHGFILHTDDYFSIETVEVKDHIALTATQNILQDIVEGTGPQKSLISLGCATWIKGQLEDEIMTNTWLITPADTHLLFDAPFNKRWDKSMQKLGINPLYLSGESGFA